jgi:hypothetical protein
MAGDGLFGCSRPYFSAEEAGVLRARKSLERCPPSQFGFLILTTMFKQREAIIRLLGDSDPETVNLTKEQLVQGGAESIPNLRDLLSTGEQQVALHVREILTEIEIRQAKGSFE